MAGTDVAKAQPPQTTQDWLVGQTGVTTFTGEDGQLAMSFSPEFVAKFNFLGPQAQVAQLDPSWKPIAKVERLNPAVDAYRRKGKWDLTKQGLTKLAQLAQIEKDGDPKWDYMDGKGVSVTVRARQRTIDGTWRHTAATKTVWFARAEAKIRREAVNSNGEALHANEIEKRIDEFYDFVASKQETKAWLRCVRELLSLPGEFTEQGLRKPFFVLGVAFVPDWSNPQISKLLEMQMRDGSRELFGAEPAMDALPAPSDKPRMIEPPSEFASADVDTPDSWDDDPDDGDPDDDFDSDGAGGEPDETPQIPRPEHGFTPSKGPHAGTNVADLMEEEAGRKWVATAVGKMRDPAKIAQGLAWLSWGCQRGITLENLDTVA